MRRIIFGFVLVGIAVSAVAQMLRQPSAESDALFAAGVDLYNKGKYREAIPLFAKSDSLDKAQIDSTSNRRVYSSMWLASCYYKMGDTATAAGIDANYRFAPVDRSLTVKSDSLSQIGMEYFNQGDYAKAVEYLTQCAEIEKSVLGDKHIFYGNSVHSIANSYAAMNDTTALKYNKLYVDIARHFYGEQSNEDIIVTANTGIMFHKFALYDRALRCFIDAYNYADSLNPNKQDLAYLVANEYKTIALSNSINDALDNLLNARLYLEKADSSSSDVKTLHLSVEKSIAYIYIEQANESYNRGDYANAIKIITEALNVIGRTFGEKNQDYATALNNLALYNYCLSNKSEALRIGEKALNLVAQTFGKENPYYASSLDNLAGYNSALGNYTVALQLEKEALYVCEKTLGKENPNYVAFLSNLASYNSLSGNYAEAVLAETEALNIRNKLSGNETAEYATSLSNLAFYNYSLKKYEDAMRLETKALRIWKKLSGDESVEYAASSHKLAGYKSASGYYKDAISLETKALNIYEKTFGKGTPNYVTLLSKLANFNYSSGNYREAIEIGIKSLSLCDSILGKNNPTYALLLNELANYNAALGNYSEAIHLGTEALEIRKNTLGAEQPDYAISLVNLAGYNSALGDNRMAVQLATEALNIFEKIVGKEHPYYATTLSALAICNSSFRDYSEAIRLESEALRIQEKVLGREHPDYATSLNNLAKYNSSLGDYTAAIRLVTEALQIQKRVLGKEHPNYANSLINLACYNSFLGNNSEAIRLGTEALNLIEIAVGKNDILTAMALVNLASYNWEIGSSDAIGYCVEATEALREIVRRTFADLTARERNLFWDKYKTWFEGTIHSIAYDMPSDSLAENGYNGALMAKGLLLNSEMELSTLLKESGDEEVANIYNNLKNLRLQINKLYEMPIAERPLDADSLERAAQGLERQLVQRSKVYGDNTANLVIDWKQVRQKLGSGEMAVEFVSFPLRNDSVMYAAYCLRKDMPLPKMVPLFEERQLTGLDKNFYFTSPALYNLIWKPLEGEMAGVTTIYFAPAGGLYNLPIESLPVDGSTYNSDIRNYRRLSSTRQLALRRDGVEVTRAAVYGGLKYDADTVALVNDSRKYRTVEPVQWSSRAVADSLNLRDGVYELPATKIEAEEIDKALETARIDTKLYTDTIGTEASFKALSGSGVNALHIATHGFYWTEREAAQLDGLAFLGADMPAAVKEDKALTRSGLLLAGANTALKGLPLPEGVEDGVLTAKEIARMDLRLVDLVALSACQTGLGEITGDGVFGLQRGFKKAGANTLLMSLWKVDDTATQLLMTQYYKNLLSGMGKYEALAAAQKYLRELEVEVKITPDKTNYQRLKDERAGKQEEAEYKTVRRYAEPKYWAAFVLLDGVN